MYLAKLLAGAGTVLFSASIWILPSVAHLFCATVRAVCNEEAELSAKVPGYTDYQRRTRLLVPSLRN